jgi:hypothetical protein
MAHQAEVIIAKKSFGIPPLIDTCQIEQKLILLLKSINTRARSEVGLSRLPVTEEIAGSNPVGPARIDYDCFYAANEVALSLKESLFCCPNTSSNLGRYYWEHIHCTGCGRLADEELETAWSHEVDPSPAGSEVKFCPTCLKGESILAAPNGVKFYENFSVSAHPVH